MDAILTDRIRQRAYYLWLASGCCDGDAEQHWLTAEREILQSCNAAPFNVVRQANRTDTKKPGRPISRATPRAITPLIN